MASTANPQGFKPVGYVGGRPYAGATREYRILSGYATRIGENDIVRMGGSGDTTSEGYIVKETGTASLSKPLGVFRGCRYTDPNTGQIVYKNQYPGSISADDIWCFVADDPDLIMEVQASGAVAQAELHQNAALVQGSGTNTTNGVSSHHLNGATDTTDTLPFRVLDFVKRPGSTVGDAYTDVLVCWNAGIHAFSVATAR